MQRLSQSCLHLWFPNIFEFKGGIQTYSAFLLNAIQQLYPNDRYEVFLKHDHHVSDRFNSPAQTRFYCSGAVPAQLRTAAFAAQLAGRGLSQRPALILSTLVNFTPVAQRLKQWLGIPYWTVVHGVDAWNIERPALKTALQQADRIVSVSHYTRDRLLKEQNLDPDRVVLLPNTFAEERFQIAPKPGYLLEQYGLTADQPTILTVARLDNSERYKGYDQILRALPQIRQQVPKVHYVLVGKGSDRTRIEQLIQTLGVQDCVTLAGFVPDSALCDHYNLCDVFAMPSKGEGFGIVYLEAMACGKPVLAGNQDGAVDPLCNGELGVLVHPDDQAAITQALIQMLQGLYPHPLLTQPQALRQETIDRFGQQQFQRQLARLLQPLENPQ